MAYSTAATAARFAHIAPLRIEKRNFPNPRFTFDDSDEMVPPSPVSRWTQRKQSFVRQWSHGVTMTLQTSDPPVSPALSSTFPSSPVASIHPSTIQITSSAPYEVADGIHRRRRRDSDLINVEDLGVRASLAWGEIDDLEELVEFEEEETMTPSSEGFTIAVSPIDLTRSSSSMKIRSHIRWLPSRIKYSLLSISKKRWRFRAGSRN